MLVSYGMVWYVTLLVRLLMVLHQFRSCNVNYYDDL